MILGVSNDVPEVNARFRARYSFPFDLLSDVDNRVALAYGAAESAAAGHHERITYLIGPDGTVRKVYAEVNAPEHPGDVLRDVEHLAA